jgi:hypothetical protein
MVRRAPRLGRICSAILLAAASPLAALAAPLSDYHERIDDAIAILSALYDDEDAGDEEAEPPPSPEEAMARVRALLPARETVEMAEGPVEVDASWLAGDLDAYAATDDPTAHGAIVYRVVARLYALDVHLQALDEATARDLAPERQKLEEILSRAEFREPGENGVARFMRELRERIGRALQTLLEALFGSERGAAFDSGLRIVVLAAGGVALLLLVRAVAQALARRKRPAKRKKKGKKSVLGEEIEETTTAADIVTSARALAARGEHREAVRKLFVALLYQLDERGLVRLRAEATNREYVALVRDVARLYPIMGTLADTFDRVWYGHEEIDREAYAVFEKQHAEAAAIIAAAPVSSV